MQKDSCFMLFSSKSCKSSVHSQPPHWTSSTRRDPRLQLEKQLKEIRKPLRPFRCGSLDGCWLQVLCICFDTSTNVFPCSLRCWYADSSPFQEAEAETQQLEEQLQEALRRRQSAAGLQMVWSFDLGWFHYVPLTGWNTMWIVVPLASYRS